MEGAMAVRVTAAHTAEAQAEAGQEAGEGGVAAAAAALAPGGFLGLPAPFSEEGCWPDLLMAPVRCPAHSRGLSEPEVSSAGPGAGTGWSAQMVRGSDEDDVHRCGRCQAEFTTLEDFVQHKLQKVCQRVPQEALPATTAAALLGQEVEPAAAGSEEPITVAHIVVEAAALTADISHAPDIVDERPYKCAKCGKSFRESGALTRHLKSLTPCTEKIRFSMSKDVVVGKEDTPTGPGASTVGTVTSSAMTGGPMETSPVIHLVTDAKGTVIHEVHVQMQELPLGVKALTPEPPSPEELPCSSEGSRENLLHQAMQNSGIVLERVPGEEGALEPAPPTVSSPQPLGDGPPELPLLEVEQVETQVSSEASAVPRTHPCPQCSETFPTAATLEAHKRGHAGPRPFTCPQCGKAFPKAYLLKKHQEVHVHERRFRCGDCGKLYKTIAHVRGHRRVHSDERPYPCPECGKCYKTKNAQQVHFRTHLEEKPHVCPFCSRGFREKGSLVRHVRHHTGEKPFKCYKCGRGFAEHGTLNRHLRTKGGCLLEVEELLVSEESPAAAAAVLADDPHTVLVEFSSVVADTQEYIIEATADDAETSEATEIIEGTQTEVDSHIMKVVQQIVHQASAGHQIIVQNVTMDQEAGLGTEAAAADTITIATPESLTEQVAMTLASAISEGTVLTARSGTNGAEQATVTMVSSEDIEILEHAGELVIASPEGQLEVQTVIV
ncbi:transcription factor E4F1 isoform X6 [Physeter macrocephalus]|uniref:Transcription factor E4F1 n=1 Tax=Physeter macrocephalus TaxID=9755 RepID=A0A455ATS8_PHYMC|nr:transcription factor E4F1 isoform X6 [Physeter catodon]|eukprot:XP_028339962.1 transcription factor E4F1 isoform X6 [Physeter catodon]